MKSFLYYFDKLTAWLDFSWLLITPKKETHIQISTSDKNDYPYKDPLLDPLLMK
jgi:hypothetical protein